MARKVCLNLVVLAMIVLLASIPAYFISSARAAGAFVFTDDAETGHLTLENDTFKIVWHYLALPSEHANEGGGNIYELYDKRTDPSTTHNLASDLDTGTGGTSPPMAGIGGLGATHMWEKGTLVATADNTKFGRMVDENHYIDADGNAVFEAGFIVSSNVAPNPDNYQVNKKWVVFPEGQVKVTITVSILRTHEIKEPAYDFSFNRDYGWDTATYKGHNWVRTSCGGIGSNGNENRYNTVNVINNIDVSRDYDYQLLHAENLTLTGMEGGASVRVKMDNDGKGFEGGGLFALGSSLWNTTANPTVEFSDYAVQAHGYTVRFHGWWGGAPSTERYKQVQAGTTWSDTLWIEIMPASAPPALEIKNLSIDPLSQDTTRIKWSTDTAADTQVTYGAVSGQQLTMRNDNWTLSHEITLNGLTAGSQQLYQIRSKDGSGEAITNGTFTTPYDGPVKLTLSLVAVRWQSYADYMNRRLSVEFSLASEGSQSARAAQLVAIRSTQGIEGSAAVPQLGDIPLGTSKNVTVTYRVPEAVENFTTQIFVRASDDAGNLYHFPSIPIS